MQKGLVERVASGGGREHSPAAPATADEILLQRVAAGNQLAMQALFARHQLRVYRFLLRIVGNAALAEDLTGDVFLTVWRQAHRFQGRSTVSTWLLAIAHNKARSQLRRRRRTEPLDDAALAIEDPAHGPDVALALKERSKIVRRCLGKLSAEHRTMIDLVYYHEKSIQEVAQIVGIPTNTVKTRTFYARKRLSELLAAAGIAGATL